MERTGAPRGNIRGEQPPGNAERAAELGERQRPWQPWVLDGLLEGGEGKTMFIEDPCLDLTIEIALELALCEIL